MSVKINAGDFKRGDLFFVDPNNVMMKEELRGRVRPPAREAIIELAVSIMEHGQRQPVECRRVEDNRLLLNMGFTRTAAVRLIRDGFTVVDPESGEEKTYHDPDLQLKVLISDGNDKQAFINNVVENAHRRQTSQIDDAYNHQKLRDQYGYSDADITRLYQYSDPGKVGRYRKLLNLPDNIQDLVHDGKLAVSAAIDLLELPIEQRQEVLQEAIKDNSNGKVDGSTIRATVREHHLRDEENKPAPQSQTPKTGKKPRSMREFRLAMEAIKDKDGNFFGDDDLEISPAHGELAKVFTLWMAGQRTNKSLLSAFDDHLKAKK